MSAVLRNCAGGVCNPGILYWRTLPERIRIPSNNKLILSRDKAFGVLDNDGSLESLYSKVDAVLEKIRSGGPR